MRKLFLLSFFCFFALVSCYKEVPDESPNPFLNSGNTTTITEKDSLDPSSFAGIHKQIFAVKCAVPLCHDGSFEPDFRSIESAYGNLVYHEVIKNNPQKSFVYRVIPKDVANSWLIERLITEDPVLGRMPLYANPLNETEMQHIKDWINAGCPDINGIPAVYPNLQPQVKSRFALDAGNNRIDTSYDGRFPAAFVVPPGIAFNLGVEVEDDSTDVTKLKNMSFQFSYDKDDFGNAVIKPAALWFSKFPVVTLSSSDFQFNKTVYFRFYCQDEHHNSPSEYPMNSTSYYFKDYFSFIVK